MSQIVLDRKRFTCYGGATNGSFTASSETNLELISSHSTGATFDIEGYSGVTSCTISAGVYDIVLHIPQWDGTGEVTSKSNRTFNFQYNDGLSSLIVQTPAVNLDSIGGAYLGSSAVAAIYLGEELMFSAGTAPVSGDRTVVINTWSEGYIEGGGLDRELVVKNGSANVLRVTSTYDDGEGTYALSVTGNGFTAEFDENDTQTISVTGPWDSAVTYSLSAITYGSQGIYYLTEWLADTLGPQGSNHFNPTGNTDITWVSNDYSAPDVTLHVTGVPQVSMNESMDYHFDSSMMSESWDIQFNYDDNATVIDTSNVGERWTVANFNSGAGTFDIIGPFLPYDDTFTEYRVYTDVTNADGSCSTDPETITFPGGTTASTAAFPYCRPDNSGGGDGPDNPGGDEDF